MTEPSDNYDPTDADLDLILEDATGKPVKPANLAAGIASLRQRITQLEGEKLGLLGQLEKADENRAESINAKLFVFDRNLTVARQRLMDHEALFGRSN